MTDFGIDHSFAQAASKVKEHYGFEVPVTSVRHWSVHHAQRIGSEDAGNHATNALPTKGAAEIIAEADGSMIPIVSFSAKKPDKRKTRQVDYQEARLCACTQKGQRATIYRAMFGSPDEVGEAWNSCAKQAGRGLNTFVHSVGDGATWVHQQATGQLGCDRFVLDFYHLCQYLKQAEPACAKNPRWFATQKNRMLRNDSQKVIQNLAEHLEETSVPDEEAPVRRAHRYLSNRADQIDYAGSQKQQLPIGSGLIESGHKHVIQARMKIAGAAWSVEVADAFIKTRAKRASNQWQQCWKN